jgi:hypothetical protein
MKNKHAIIVYINAIILTSLALYFFIIPAGMLIYDLNDPGLLTGNMPRFVYRWHQTMSPRFENWARDRVISGVATDLNTNQIAETEWPVYSSVFYLWATESLQEAWEQDPSLSRQAPNVYAKGAIEAAAALVSDPKHASWVKKYWGEDYLKRENLFYRMLLISGWTSYQKLTGDERYRQQLATQVETLAAELDASPFGLINDYPNQCYPIDILPAIANIRRADAVLGTDHSAFAARAIRGFEGTRLDSNTSLPGYIADPANGNTLGPARGVGNSTLLIWAPELWPETSRKWYQLYETQFWQDGPVVDGFREYSRNHGNEDWLMVNVDAGPILWGYGTTASAFGIGAARANGHYDQAYPLAAEALVAAWPLPDGTLLSARMLSSVSGAPFTGEAALLFALTRRPLSRNENPAGSLPPIVYIGLFVYLVIGIFLIALSVAVIRRWKLKDHHHTLSK